MSEYAYKPPEVLSPPFSLEQLRERARRRELVRTLDDGTEMVFCGEGSDGYIGWTPRYLAEANGYEICRTDGQPELLALIEVAEAAFALVEDTENGGSQHARREPCGDSSCGYASCRLAVALTKFTDS